MCVSFFKTRQKSIKLFFDLISEKDKKGKEMIGRRDLEVGGLGIFV